MTGRLQDRLAVITGASRGIGRAVALGMAAEGAHVILVAKTVGGLEEVDDEIRKVGGKATLVPMDLTDFPAIDRLGATIFERWGKLDILIANAGLLGTLTPLSHMEPKDWDKTLAVNVTANYRLIRSLEPLLKRVGRGTRGVRDVGCSAEVQALLGRLFGDEGGARRHDEDMGGGNGEDADPRELGEPRTDAHRDAQEGDAGRRSDDADETRGTGAAVRSNSHCSLASGMARSWNTRR